MSDEETKGPGAGLDIYGLTEAELARVLLDEGLAAEGGSPLAKLSLDPGDTDPGLADALPSGVRAGLERVARPDRVVAMVMGAPPGPAEQLWFYGRDGDLDFAWYSGGDGDGHHLAWPVDGVTMLDLASAPLALARGAEPTALSVAVGPEEFCTLCVLADFLRQETLRGLLTPVPGPKSLPRFGPGDLTAVAARAGSLDDLGWMVPRAGVISPVPLDFGEDTLAAGLESLRESGLLVPEGDQDEFSILLHGLCLQLGLCEGFSAVSNWLRDLETGAWTLEHFALSRSPGSLLLLEFQEVTESGFLLAVDDVTPELAFHWLNGALPVPPMGPWSELEELPEAPAPAESASGPPGAGAGADPAPVPRFCTVCGTALDPEKRFCTSCGTPVKETGAHD